MSAPPEFWLRGPVPGFSPTLLPVAHSLLQVREEVAREAAALTPAELWVRPGGAASAGFHLRHLAGSLDRLLTYARGEGLTEAQLAFLRAEGEPGEPPAEAEELLRVARSAIERALEQVRGTPEATLPEPRRVGRAGLPSTVLGLLFHAAEHTQRHLGQIVATAKVVRAETRSIGSRHA